MIDFQRINGWYKDSFRGRFFGGLSLPGRPAHTLTYPWPAKIPCQLRSPKDIINPKIIIFWEKTWNEMCQANVTSKLITKRLEKSKHTSENSDSQVKPWLTENIVTMQRKLATPSLLTVNSELLTPSPDYMRTNHRERKRSQFSARDPKNISARFRSVAQCSIFFWIFGDFCF